MEVSTQSTDNISTFLKNFSSQSPTNGQQPQQGAAVPEGQQTQDDENKDKPEGEGENVENLLNKGKTQTQDPPKFFETPEALADKLLEEKLIYPFDDGEKPKTTEELLDALKQSSLFNAEQEINKRWEDKISNLSPTMQTIIQYAEGGITSAGELSKFIGEVSQLENVSALDPSREEDQEKIVYLQLLNTGYDDKSAREEIADLKERKKLDAAASKYQPILVNAYKSQAQQTFLNKQREIEEEQQYVESNHTNVTSFLGDETSYLPFKIARKDKAATYELAARPVDYTENGEAVYGWQKYIQNLQYGTEAQFKEYMKIMTFIANTKGYDEGLKKVQSVETKKENFKKINTGGKSNNPGFQEDTDVAPVIRRQSNQPWSTKG